MSFAARAKGQQAPSVAMTPNRIIDKGIYSSASEGQGASFCYVRVRDAAVARLRGVWLSNVHHASLVQPYL